MLLITECVATSAIEDRKGTSPYNYGDTSLVTSHSCTLNLCLGGGGFDCIAIFAGTYLLSCPVRYYPVLLIVVKIICL